MLLASVFFFRLFPNYHLGVANAMLLNANLGVGLYLFSRPHMACFTTSMTSRVVYSVFGTVVFNFGSILLWATTKAVLPQCTMVKAIFGLVSGAGMLYIGHSYIKMLDENATKEK